MSDSQGCAARPGCRRIYIDIDDCLSRTFAALIDLFAEVHGRRIAYEDATEFDLGRVFGLGPEQLDQFFDLVHEDSVMRNIALVEGGPAALAHWDSAGYEIHLLTGRPPTTEAATRGWLEHHAIPHSSLSFVDKYGRAKLWPEGSRPLSLRDVGEMEFCLAVEDSLEVAVFLAEQLEIDVALIDHPWNRDTAGLSQVVRDRLIRCRGWSDVIERFPAP